MYVKGCPTSVSERLDGVRCILGTATEMCHAVLSVFITMDITIIMDLHIFGEMHFINESKG